MATWIRFQHDNKEKIGTRSNGNISVYEGDIFTNPKLTDITINEKDIVRLNPCNPSKMIALWNNYKTLADEKGLSKPNNPLYLNKSISSILQPKGDILRPKFYSEAIFYEGELGIVIGKHCKDIETSEANNYIFGYTCINDVTGMDLVKKDPTFDQWTRSKSFDTFGIFGPGIVTDINPMNLQVMSTLNGKIVQDYNTNDMFFNVFEIVSYLSKDMSLYPGDIIACGTNAGLGPMNEGDVISIEIEGIGSITNKMAS